MPIIVEKLNGTTCKVTVSTPVTTEHVVTVSEEYWRKLTDGKVTPEKLIEKSFEFLLNREPNTSIFRTFDLPTIQHYFPDYEDTIRTMLD